MKINIKSGKKILQRGMMVFTVLCFPYVVTLAWTGSVAGSEQVMAKGEIIGSAPELISRRKILLDRDGSRYMDVEEYLIGAVAKQIPADYHLEALKAQAVIARTYIYGVMGEQTEIAESALDMDYLEQGQLEKLWGTDRYPECYEKIKQAVKDTATVTMEYEGSYIEPLFCRSTGGKTRPLADLPYLAQVNCPQDVEAEGNLQVTAFSLAELSDKLSAVPGKGKVGKDQILQGIQVVERDLVGYVKQLQIGETLYSGDEIRYGLGLNSSLFRFEQYEDKIRVIVNGQGHGYGLSQYDANRKAQDGWNWDEILTYFYKNIMLVSE